jgi:hypothetical protein
MENRERICNQVMLLCFTAGGLILLHGMSTQNRLAQAQPVQSAPQIQPVAYRGSGRIDVQ